MNFSKKIFKAIIITIFIIATMTSFSLISYAEETAEIDMDIDWDEYIVEISPCLYSEKPAVLYIAFYNSNGSLITVLQEETPFADFYSTEIPYGTFIIKAMMWEKDTCLPLCESSIDIIYNGGSRSYGFLNNFYCYDEFCELEIIDENRDCVVYEFAEKVLFNGEFIYRSDISFPTDVYMLPLFFNLNESNEIDVLFAGEDALNKIGVKARCLSRNNISGSSANLTYDYYGNITGIESVSYYEEDAYTDYFETRLKIAQDAKVYINKNYSPMPTEQYRAFAANWSAGNYPEVVLYDINFDNRYDIINVVECESSVISEIDTEKGIIYTDLFRLVIGNDDDSYSFCIKDITGQPLDFYDLKTGDIITRLSSYSDTEDYAYDDIIVGGNSFEGEITEVINGNIYTINETHYYSDMDIYVGTKGIFYTNMYNEIVYFEETLPELEYGLLYAFYDNYDYDEYDPIPTAVILTKDGEYHSYQFAKNIIVNGQHISNFYISDLEDLQNTALISYLLNDEGKISLIYTDAEIEEYNDSLYYKELSSGSYYDEQDSTIGRFKLTKNSFIIGCRNDSLGSYYLSKDDFFVASNLLFIDDYEYKLNVLTDENDEIIFAVVFEAAYITNPASIPMYITQAGDTIDSQGDIAFSARGYVNGEKKEIAITGNCNSDYVYTSIGSVVQYLGESEPLASKILFGATDYLYIEDFERGSRDELYTFASRVESITPSGFSFENGKEITFDHNVPAMIVCVNGYNVVAAYCENVIASDAEMGDYLILIKYNGNELGAVIVDTDMSLYIEPEYDDHYSLVVSYINPESNEIWGRNLFYNYEFCETLDYEYEPYIIKDENGSILTFSDIKENDILSISYTDENIKEIIVSHTVKEGIVSAVYDNIYVIGGEDFKCYPDYFFPGDKGEFYIDATGTIAYFEADTSDRNFGFLYTLYNEDLGFDELPMAYMLTSFGTYESLAFANTVVLNGETVNRYNLLEKINYGIYTENYKSLALYKLNDNYEICELYTGYHIEEFGSDYIYDPFTERTYSVSDNSLGYKYLNESTIIAVCEDDSYADNPSAYYIADEFTFADEERYSFTAICDSANNYIFIMFFNPAIYE